MGGSTFYQRHCIYLPAILGWFACSAALTSYNKVRSPSFLPGFTPPVLAKPSGVIAALDRHRNERNCGRPWALLCMCTKVPITTEKIPCLGIREGDR